MKERTQELEKSQREMIQVLEDLKAENEAVELVSLFLQTQEDFIANLAQCTFFVNHLVTQKCFYIFTAELYGLNIL